MLFFIVDYIEPGNFAPTFKYISCYSLSAQACKAITDAIEFKYISCYSLSKALQHSYPFDGYLNTSHVILYRIYTETQHQQR